MSYSGEAADQVVRLSLNGVEVAAKLSGSAAKQLAIMIYAILKDQKKTKGKIRLTNMLRSGKELKVFAVKDGDLQKFCEEAKKYGVLYCVLKDKNATDGITDIMVRAEDAAKNSRNTACANGGVKRLYRFCRRACQLGRQLCGLFCSQCSPASSGGCGMNTFLRSSGGGLLGFLGSMFCGCVGHFLCGSLGGLDRNGRIPSTNGQVGFLPDRDFLFRGGITRRKRSVMETI